MFDVIKTIYSDLLANALKTNTPYQVLGMSTLNEKFNTIHHPTTQSTPILKYYTIGMTYEDMVHGEDVSLSNVKHEPIDVSLYRHIPFVMVLVSEDISNEERAKYRI